MKKGVYKKKSNKLMHEDIKKSMTFKLLIISIIVLGFLIIAYLILNIAESYIAKKSELKVFDAEESLGSIGLFGTDPLSGVYFPEDCSDTSLTAAWDSIFQESSQNAILIKDNGCNTFLLYKNEIGTNKYRIIFGIRNFIITGIISGIYGNLTDESINILLSINSENVNTFGVMEYIGNLTKGGEVSNGRNINILSTNDAQGEYTNIFKISSSNWVYNSDLKSYSYNETSSGNNFTVFKFGRIYESNLSDISLFAFGKSIYLFNFGIPNQSYYKNSDWSSGIDLDNYFTSNLKLNYSIYNLSGNRINHTIDSNNLLKFKPETNFSGKETFKILAYNDTNYAESNIFEVNISEFSCTDSDNGQNYTLKGSALNSTSNGTDVCFNNTYLREYYCNGSVVANYIIPCSSNLYCNDGACVLNTSLNRTPVFLSSNCDITKFTWYNNTNFSTNIANCFSDPDGDALTYRTTNSHNDRVAVYVSGPTLYLIPNAGWIGTGDFYLYANDTLHETSATINFQVNPTPPINQTPPINPTPVIVISPIPNLTDINESYGRNLTFTIGNSITSIDSVKWYLDSQLIKENSLAVLISGLSSGSHILEVIIKKGAYSDSKTWRINIYEEKPANPFVFDSGKVVLILIIVVVIMVIIMTVWLFIQENQRKKKFGINLSGLDKKSPGNTPTSMPGANNFNIPR